MEEHCHVVLVIRCIKASDVEQGIALAVAKGLGVQRRSPVVIEPDGAVLACILNISRTITAFLCILPQTRCR